MDNMPNPGSDAAVKQGCTCPVLDNNHGKGFPWGSTDEPVFWINANCPLHGCESEYQSPKSVPECFDS